MATDIGITLTTVNCRNPTWPHSTMTNSLSSTAPPNIPEKPTTETKLTVEQLLGALDTQIKFESDSQRNEGWTRWAIWGAIATLVWITSGLWAQSGFDISRAAIASLLLFVLWKFLEELKWILLPNSRMEIGVCPTRFLPAADAIHPLRPEIMVTLIQYILIIGALAYFKLWGQWILWVYATIAFIGALVMLFSGWLLIGFPGKVSIGNIIKGLTGLQLACLATSGLQISKTIYPDVSNFSLADVRFALAANAIASPHPMGEGK